MAMSRVDSDRWDALYARAPDRVWSGAPNGSLVVEASPLPAGRALDVGCGEGADAIWLAQRGWRVTAVDISTIAIQRARTAGSTARVEVDWRCIDLLVEPPPAATYDLVSLQYPALLEAAGVEPFRRLLAAVAPGGTILVVGHADVEHHHGDDHDHGHHRDDGDDGDDHENGVRFDPAEFFGVAELRTLLRETGFEIDVDEVRPRPNPPADAHHARDAVLRARRR